MSHLTCSDYEFCFRHRKIRREKYSEIMDEIIPPDEPHTASADRKIVQQNWIYPGLLHILCYHIILSEISK